MKISQAEAQTLFAKAKRAQAQLASMRERGEEIVGVGINSACSQGGAFAMSVINGRFGATEIMGVPAEFVGYALGHAAGLAGMGGAPLHAAADGILNAYVVPLGVSIGQDMRRKAGLGPVLPTSAQSAGSVFDPADVAAGGR